MYITPMSISKPLLGLLLIILVAHYAGIFGELYWTFPWYDGPMHVVGGAWVALLFFYLLERQTGHAVGGSFLSIIMRTLGFVVLVGVLWEFYEYIGDVLILHKYPWGGALSGQAFDTLKDLFNDLLGAFFASLWYRLRAKRNLPPPATSQ